MKTRMDQTQFQHYCREQHLWALLGMKMGEEMAQEQVQPLPEEAATNQGSRVGEQQLVRLEVGEPRDKGSPENCPFSGTVVELQPAQVRAAGGERLQCLVCVEQPEKPRFGVNSSSILLTRRCALRARTKALCGSGKGQVGQCVREERYLLGPPEYRRFCLRYSGGPKSGKREKWVLTKTQG